MWSNKAETITLLIKLVDMVFCRGKHIILGGNRMSGRRLTYVLQSRVRWVQCNIEEVKVFESLWELRVDPDLDTPAPSPQPPPPPPPPRRSNPSDVVLRAPPQSLIYHLLHAVYLLHDCTVYGDTPFSTSIYLHICIFKHVRVMCSQFA